MNEAITTIDVLNWVKNHIAEIIAFCAVFVEISPIKIDPISAVLKLLFKPIRNEIADMKTELKAEISNVKTELKSDIDSVKSDFNSNIEQINKKQEQETESIIELIKAYDQVEISRIRWDIIEFSNSIDNGQLHTRDEYRHILDDNRKYHSLIDKYGLENGIIDEEVEKIKTHYEENKNCTAVYF